MVRDSDGHSASQEQLSALVDGELDEAQVLKACQRFRENGDLRVDWYAYQLIGDVLRSDDLSGDPGHDAAFLAAFRVRLDDEPVVLAPPSPSSATSPSASAQSLFSPRQAGAGARSRHWAWMTPSAVAAGFVAVAGVLFVTRAPDAGSAIPVVASAQMLARVAAPSGGLDGSFQRASVSSPDSAAPPTIPRALAASGKLIRDVRLDRYLSAHKEFAGSSALGIPSGFLRNATADASDR